MILGRWIPALAVLVALAGASNASAGTPDRGGAPSLEALLFRAVEALNAKDTSALASLTADRADFDSAWRWFAPDTSADRREFAAGYFLSDNRKLMRRACDRAGGNRLSLSRFTVARPPTPLGASELRGGLSIWVTRGTEEIELEFVESAIRTGSSWKIWSWADD